MFMRRLLIFCGFVVCYHYSLKKTQTSYIFRYILSQMMLGLCKTDRLPQQGFHTDVTKSVSTSHNLHRIFQCQATNRTFPILRNFTCKLVIIPAQLGYICARRHFNYFRFPSKPGSNVQSCVNNHYCHFSSNQHMKPCRRRTLKWFSS